MVLNNLWKKYEKYVLKYTDLNRQFYSLIGLLIAMIPFIIFNYLFYHLILGFNNEYLHYGMLFLGLGKGRLLLLYIMLKNNCNIGKGHNWFTILLSVFSVGTGVIGMIYLTIKDINGDFKKVPKAKIETIKYNNNFLNTTNKYDYLKNDNK